MSDYASDGSRNGKKEALMNRLLSIKSKLEDNGVDGMLVSKRENFMYLSGFTGSFSYLVITANHSILITDGRYNEQAAQQAPFFEIVKYTKGINAELNEIIKKCGIRKLGFESLHLSYDKFLDLKEKLEVEELKPLKNVVESLRVVKDEEEINLIRTAVRIADEAFSHVLPYIKPGVSELEVAAGLEYFVKKRGGEGASFKTIVASGKRSSMAHGVASEKLIEDGDPVVLDFGAVYRGYCSDMTRTVFVGRKPCAKMEEIYNTVLTAQVEALKRARRGMTGKEIDSIAREIIKGAGYGDNFGHGLGHGVGLEIHEDPSVASSETAIEKGMVVTIEPGIYIEGFGGVRIEDMIVMGDDEPIVLTASPKDMIIL
ncbi:MAG: aminopeptidase P family protein [Clostridiaceae bacterium]|nr:aminopeptidase P family protein [Clostridiaceae bacterium]